MGQILNTFIDSVKNWYLPFLLGIIFILTGIYLLTTPLETYLTLSILFSLSFIVSGFLDVFFSIQNRKTLSDWGWYLIGGIISILMGIVLVVYPELSIGMLPFVVGFTVMLRSFQLLGFSLDLRDLVYVNTTSLIIISICGIIFSFILILNPLFSGISLVAFTAAAFIAAGMASVILSYKLKKIKDYPQKLKKKFTQKVENIKSEAAEESYNL
ncbi:TPA: HdeD family acid-resistance protein [Elizabethkingia anophelis]